MNESKASMRVDEPSLSLWAHCVRLAANYMHYLGDLRTQLRKSAHPNRQDMSRGTCDGKERV